MRTLAEVKHAFTPSGKLTSTQQIKMMKVQNAYENLSAEVMDLVPESADRTHALRQLLDSKFWCSQAITHEVLAKEAPPTPDAETK